MKKIAFLFFLVLASGTNTYGQQSEQSFDTIQHLDEVIIKANTILGNQFVAKNRTGSAYFISSKELAAFSATDISQVLSRVPGINFYEEDGFGLRPNLSIRGTSPQRSAKITLMEDGVLIAPAPYSAPAAYYFPTIFRMEAVELLKGSSQIQYGPHTTGGALNMVSTSIPDSFQARFKTNFGSFNSSQILTAVGDQKGPFGYLLEYANYNSDGFKNLDSNDHTGFDITDVVAKTRWIANKNAKNLQSVELKYHFYDERSNETYLGLTQHDFLKNPYQRYAASQGDLMEAQQQQVMVTHTIEFNKLFEMTTTGYFNQFKRNWYKLDDVIFQGNKQSLAQVVSNPEEFSTHLELLTGAVDGAVNSLLLKANNRTYTSKGIQTKLDRHWYSSNGAFNDVEFGLRYHYDNEDRFQWEDGYQLINKDLVQNSEGVRGAQGNRISSATAFSSYLLYKWKHRGLTLTPGVRLEDITLMRTDYGSSDAQRTGSDLNERSNKVSVWIPGVGFNYTLSNQLSIFGGVHKGFSPPGSKTGEMPELSVNYELGSRFNLGSLSAELVGFVNDYENLLGSDNAASGGTGSLDQFNAGAVLVHGLEVLLNYQLITTSNFQWPMSITYTLTNALFQTDFTSSQELWGAVTIGDRVPYIPQHQWNINTGIVLPKLELNFNARYQGSFPTLAGIGPESKPLASYFIINAAARYKLSDQIDFKMNAINLLNEVYAASRVPAGFRAGHPFGLYAGISFQL